MIRIELAGVPAEIRCRYPQSEDFLRDYETDKEPLLYIEPTDEDLERIQANFDRMAEAEGNAPKRYSRRFLENNAIHALLAEALVQHNVLLMHTIRPSVSMSLSLRRRAERGCRSSPVCGLMPARRRSRRRCRQAA